MKTPSVKETLKQRVHALEKELTRIRASEERYRSLVEDRPGFIVRWTPSGRLLFANKNYCQYFGKAPEQIDEWLFTESIHPEYRDIVDSRIAKLSIDIPSHSGERRVLLPDGTIGWNHWTDRAIFDDAGRLIEIESTGYDISEQKTSEKAIRNIAEEITGLVGELFFRSLMNYLADVLDADHAMIARFADDGKTRLKVIAEFNHGRFIDGIEYQTENSPFAKIIADGFAIYFKDIAADFPDSGFIRESDIHSMAGTLLNDSKNNPIGVLSVMDGKAFKNEPLTRNILRLFAFRAAAELEREESDRALRQSEQLFRMLAENAKDMIFRASLPEGKYEYASPASTAISGYTPMEISAFQSFVEFVRAIVHPAFKPEFDKIWNKFKSGKIRPYYEYKIIHKSGDEKWVLQRSVLIYDKAGQPAAIEGIVTDITERKNLENKIVEMQKMQAIGTLAGGIAHDFNNILGVIIGNAEMLELFDLPAKSPIRSRLKKLIDAGYRAKELISQILTFASINEQAKQSLPIKPIVKDAVKFLRSSLPATIDIQLNIENPDIAVVGDPVQIQRVLVNLGTNAGQAMEGKKGKLSVSLGKIKHTGISDHVPADVKPGDYAVLTVEDTGKGMEPAVMERIFEPYFTTKQYGEGIGLGLAVVHGIIKAHKGFITVHSQPGQGSIFKVLLPAIDQAAQASGVLRPKAKVKGNERLLFVDDEIFIVDVYKEILEKYGYHVVGKTSAQEALSVFRLQPDNFDLVITDMTMPQMTGDELIREILKIRPEIPVILCTGYNIKFDQDALNELNVRDFIKKPIGAKQLAEKIRQVLDGAG